MATKSKTSQQQKRELKKLREKGLYSPKDARSKPTKYALSMLRKYRDVLEGRAAVLTIPKSKKTKGWKAARDNADPGLGVYSVRNKLIVPKSEGEKISWSPKKKTYRVSRWSGDKTTRYVREPINRKISNPDQLKLLKGQRVSIPFNRPGRGLEWMNLTEKDFKEAWAQYKENGNYRTMGEHLHIFYVVQNEK
jgi:hypothetical protein